MIPWVLTDATRNKVLIWASMPRIIWDNLCTAHQILVVAMWFDAGAPDHPHPRSW